MAKKKKKNKKQYTFISEIFLERLTEMFGVSLSNQIKDTFVEKPTTFRVNTIKADKNEVRENLFKNGFKFKDVAWYKDAFVLLNKSKRELTDLDIYKEGKIYVQSLASMVPPLALDPQPGEKVLDLTAAPGSKTSEIAALMSCEGELVANDSNKVRFFKLKHNMENLGVFQISSDAQQNDDWQMSLRMEHGSFLCREYSEYFDKILLDAPCSAETRFLADKPKTFGYWSERKIKEMAYKQWKLLLSAWSALKPGGTLVYSTCTFAPEENESQITKFLGRNPDCEVLSIDSFKDTRKLPIVKEFKGKQISSEVIKNALRILPSKEIEGFFVVKMKKKH